MYEKMPKYPNYSKWKTKVENDEAGKFLIINIATSGLPVKNGANYYDPSNLDAYENSRIVQIVWGVYDDEKKEIAKSNYIIIPDNFNINKDASKIHGITNEKAAKDGYNINFVFDQLANDVQECEYIISHNVEFDYNILMSELYRYNCIDLSYIIKFQNRICTGEATKNLLKMKTTYGNTYKMPKLGELYKWCFGKDIGAYNVNNNHKCLVDIFFHLKNKYKMIRNE